MRPISAWLMLSAIFILATACAGTPTESIEIPKDAVPLTVDFSWQGVGACTHDSPAIRVDGVPPGTVALRVRLKNLTVPEWNQGGGQVEADGSGVIPARALDIGYNGPCPPVGERHKYEFRVMAVDADDAIIGYGKAMQPFPPK